MSSRPPQSPNSPSRPPAAFRPRTPRWWEPLGVLLTPEWADDGRASSADLQHPAYYERVGPGWQPIIYGLYRRLERLGHRIGPESTIWMAVHDGMLLFTFPQGRPSGTEAVRVWRALASAQQQARRRCELCSRRSMGVQGLGNSLRLCAYHWDLGDGEIPVSLLRKQAWRVTRQGTGCLRVLLLGGRPSAAGLAQALVELLTFDDRRPWISGESGWLSFVLLEHALNRLDAQLLRALDPVDFLPILSHSQAYVRELGMRLLARSEESCPTKLGATVVGLPIVAPSPIGNAHHGVPPRGAGPSAREEPGQDNGASEQAR